MIIPKIIHQCYLGYDNPTMPKKWMNNHKKWKELHPNYQIMLWNYNDSIELIKEIDKSFLSIFKNYKYNAQRADSIRNFILYKYGGIYIDLDTVPVRNITPLINVYTKNNKIEVLMGTNSNFDDFASNWFMASVPKNDFWLLAIKYMKNRYNLIYLIPHIQIMKTTGPTLYNDILNENPNLNNNVVMVNRKLLNTNDACNDINTNEQEYIIDQHASSWHNTDSKFFNFIYCTTKSIKKVKYYHWLLIFILLIFIIIFLIEKIK